ncbi:MAG: helix-turn-helix domain-containing protein [Clostridia bacterium]|nr:helix-turn-helix domain-containing protein [Clostridia bacterium]
MSAPFLTAFASGRLEPAKRYLPERPELRVREIAPLCGFGDSAYFCKVFRDSERMTPGAYRTMMQTI